MTTTAVTARVRSGFDDPALGAEQWLLLRQLLIAAIDEGAHTFDFGLGDESFKTRFATRVDHVRNWGLYHPRAVANRAPLTTPV